MAAGLFPRVFSSWPNPFSCGYANLSRFQKKHNRAARATRLL